MSPNLHAINITSWFMCILKFENSWGNRGRGPSINHSPRVPSSPIQGRRKHIFIQICLMSLVCLTHFINHVSYFFQGSPKYLRLSNLLKLRLSNLLKLIECIRDKAKILTTSESCCISPHCPMMTDKRRLPSRGASFYTWKPCGGLNNLIPCAEKS